MIQGRAYYFWLEVGAPVVGAIDAVPTDLPREHLPDGARLTVALFGFDGEIELTAGADVGEIQIRPDRSVRVTRPVGRPEGLSDEALLDRRLFFPVHLPRRTGTLRLRCNLYYEQVLVQSHLVQARVVSGPIGRAGRSVLAAAGRIARRVNGEALLARLLPSCLQTRIDYTLSHTLRPERLARLEPHRLSLLLNDNGNGTHGFRFFGRDDQAAFKQDATLSGQELQNLIDQARGALRQAAWGDATPWHHQPYRYDGPADEDRLRGDLVRLARWGYRFYDTLIDRLAAGGATDRVAIRTAVKTLKRLMQTPGYVQVASKDSARHVVPVALFYDHALDTTLPTERYRLCPAFLDALHTRTPLLTTACFQGHCPSTEHDDVVCPAGFWGFRHHIGLPVTIGGSLRDLATEIPVEAAPQLTVAVSTDQAFVRRPAHEQALQGLRDDLGWHYAATRDDALALMQTTPAHLLYFYCHGGLQNDLPYLQVGAPEEHGYITRDLLRNRDIFWTAPQPLVFLNGCHTTALEPEQALNLVSGFIETANAAGVLGTEITVFEPLACAFAEECLRLFLDEVPIGEAVRRARLTLLQDGNPLGLVYIPFVIASLRMVRAGAGLMAPGVTSGGSGR
ncbi:MAG: CHAT domain-containing protein [Bacteroidetes bacterium]|nr:MAG: CHAT domain-containing protein [Bacteroidota bacterium]